MSKPNIRLVEFINKNQMEYIKLRAKEILAKTGEKFLSLEQYEQLVVESLFQRACAAEEGLVQSFRMTYPGDRWTQAVTKQRLHEVLSEAFAIQKTDSRRSQLRPGEGIDSNQTRFFKSRIQGRVVYRTAAGKRIELNAEHLAAEFDELPDIDAVLYELGVE